MNPLSHSQPQPLQTMKNLRHLPLLCAALCAILLLLSARDLQAQATATPPGKMSYQGASPRTFRSPGIG